MLMFLVGIVAVLSPVYCRCCYYYYYCFAIVLASRVDAAILVLLQGRIQDFAAGGGASSCAHTYSPETHRCAAGASVLRKSGGIVPEILYHRSVFVHSGGI